jgi:sugar lactone lactonase YvrE
MVFDTLLGGRAFLEGPRWRVDGDGRGALYVSDMHAHEVLRVSTNGDVDVVASLDTAPSGLGWLPDGTMLVVSMDDRKLLRLDGGGLAEVADCSQLAPAEINDMVVDRHGHAFISQFGFDFHGGEKFASAPLLRVDPDGSTRAVSAPLRFANGMVITADERTLVVAESAGHDLVAFDLDDDGAISNQRVWAELPDVPDGICIDADDGVWIASPVTGACTRVREGGEVTDVVQSPANAIACALGGDDGHTLFVCTSPTTGEPEKSRELRGAKVEMTTVDVPARRS